MASKAVIVYMGGEGPLVNTKKAITDACGERIRGLIMAGHARTPEILKEVAAEFGVGPDAIRRRWNNWVDLLASEGSAGKDASQSKMTSTEFINKYDYHTQVRKSLTEHLSKIGDAVYSDSALRLVVCPQAPKSAWDDVARDPQFLKYQLQVEGGKIHWCSIKNRLRFLESITSAKEVETR